MSRRRSNSVKQALDSLEPTSGINTERPVASPNKGADATVAKKRVEHVAHVPPAASSAAFGWLVKPSQSLAIIAVTCATYFALEYTRLVDKNPLAPLLFISYPLTPTVEELATGSSTRYGKGPLDLVFLVFYIVVFSFLRQSITEFVIRPFCMSLGLKSKSKITRFMEQAYAVVYFTASGSYGLVSRQASAGPSVVLMIRVACSTS